MSSDDDRRRREKSAEEEYDYLYETLEQQDYDAITRFHEYLKHFLTYGAYWKTWRGRRRLIKRWSEMSEEEQIAAIAEPGPRSPSPSSSEDGRITKDIIANGEWVYAKAVYPRYEHYRKSYWPPRRLVSLYVDVDDQYNVIDRMIVKRQDYAYDDDLAELQNEIKFHKKASLTGSNQIVHLRDATRREELSMVYIYMDYSPGGDLYTLAWKAENEKKQIPEIYLWIIFDAISEALHILKTGQAAVFDDVGEAIEVENSSGWGHPLVHLDIKPDNIFLGAPTAPYMGYLTPQLGDFGQVAEYYEGVDYDDLRGGGTPGWGPPEQRDPPEDMWEVPYTDWADGALTEPLDDKSDIWTLGLVIWTLMRSSSFNHDEMEAARDELRFDDEERESVFAADIVAKLPRYDGMYSTKLEDLVKKCLEVKRVRRPDILELRGETCKGLLKAQEVFGNPAVARKEDLMEHLRLSFREEIFKIGGPGPERWKNRKKRKAPARVDSPVTAYGDSDGDGSGSKRRKTRSVHGDGEQRVQGDDDNSGNVIRPSNDEEDDNNVPEAQGPQIEDPNIDRPAGLVQVAAPTDPIRLGLLDAAFSGDPTGRSGFLWYNAVLSARAKDELKWYLGKGRYPSLIKKWDKLNNDDKAMYRRWT